MTRAAKTRTRSSKSLVVPASQETEGAYLGIEMENWTSGLERGVVIEKIILDSPAYASLLEVGDIILSLITRTSDGVTSYVPILGVIGMTKALKELRPSTEIELVVLRDVAETMISVTLAEVPKEAEVEAVEIAAASDEPLFPLIVHSFPGPLPGQDKYKPEKDRLLIGFKLGSKTVPIWLPSGTKLSDVGSYDFLTNPNTGIRAGQTMKPYGGMTCDLTNGIGEYDVLPPVHIWKTGMWLADAYWKTSFEESGLPHQIKEKIKKITWPSSGTPAEIYNYWLVTGEGTPGNNVYRVYELPDKIAGTQHPHHPTMWPEELQKKKSASFGTTTGGTTTSSTSSSAPKIPAGVRFRCGGCGHWFQQSDLPGHAQICGKGEESDWAMMCHTDCGCRTLDEACASKPGFPRLKKPEEKPAEVAAETITTP